MPIATILLLHHSHTDIGYTNYQETVFANHRAYMRQAMDLCERYADGAAGERFVWTCETTILAEDFLRHARDAEIERLLALHRRGLIDFGAMYCNVTPLFSAGQLARSLAVAAELRRNYGLDIRYAMNCDVNGQSWALPELLLDAGIAGLTMAINRVMAGAPGLRPRAFHWQGPSGRSMPVWHGEIYGYGHNLGIPRRRVSPHSRLWASDLEAAHKQVAAYLAQLEAQGYPHDFLFLQITTTFLWDNGPPIEELVRFVQGWNARGYTPRLELGGLAQLFERIALQPAAALPTLRGEWTDWWAQGVASSAYETALVRQAHGLRQAAQGLGALLHGLPAASYPWDEDAAAWQNLALYDEHTWGGFDSISHASSANTRGQWARKATYAYAGAAAARRLAQGVQRDLAQRLPQPDELRLTLFNPLPWPRRVPLLLPPFNRTGWDTAQTERDLELADPHGPIPPIIDYGVVDLPACGYAVIPARMDERPLPGLAVGATGVTIAEPQPVRLAPEIAPGLAPSFAVSRDGWVLDSPHYRVEIHPANGAIASLCSKATGEEWVDASTPWGLGHYIYETNRSPRGRYDMQLRWDREAPPDRDRQPDLQPERRGPTRVVEQRFIPGVNGARVLLRLEAPGAADLYAQIVLYDDLPWIDLIYDIDKLPLPAAESVYIAFPLALEQPTSRYEAAGAIVVAEAEQLPFACRDYYAVQRWVDLTDARRGMTLATPDAPMLHLGGFTNHSYRDKLGHEQPLLLSWAMNNHWCTNFCLDQRGWVRLRYRLLPHDAPFDPVMALRLGAEAAVAPLIGPVWDRAPGLEQRVAAPPPQLPEQASLLELAPDHVQIVGLAPATDGRGVLVHLQELAGSTADVRLRFPQRRIAAAERCAITGEPGAGAPPTINENGIGMRIAPRAIETLRVVFARDQEVQE
jgi:alpha-mannosidase